MTTPHLSPNFPIPHPHRVYVRAGTVDPRDCLHLSAKETFDRHGVRDPFCGTCGAKLVWV